MKTYLIIGESGGIGSAVSLLLTSQGNTVYGTYNNNEKTTTNPTIQRHHLNVLDEELNLDFLPDQIDGLVYCPGSINLKPFKQLNDQDFLNDYQLNVLGAVKVIREVLPKLKKSGEGSIVLFSTAAVKMGFNFHSTVSSSKGAIEGLTKALAAEFAPKVRVNCIAPSITHTPLADKLLNTDKKMEANAKRHPLQRVGQPNDIASAVSFLLSQESAWMTGEILHIDGGITTIRG